MIIERLKIFLLLVIILFIFPFSLLSEDKDQYFYYPEKYGSYEYHFLSGISVAKLPVIISENEISHSPMLFAGFRIGLPYEITGKIEVSSNYISSIAGLNFGWTFLDDPLLLSFGISVSGWYGHLELDYEDFNSRGWILSPNITLGKSFGNIYLSAIFQSIHSRYYTYSENEFLGIVRDPSAGLVSQFNIEQPLWDDHYVVLGLRVTYSKFFYQSWLSYSTIDDYLIYPEIIFGVIL